MELPRKQAETVRKTLEAWQASGLLDRETGQRLLADLVPLPFDWYRLGRYALWAAIACILIGIAALFTDSWIIELVERFFTFTGLGRCLTACLVAAGLFFWGARRRSRFPEKRLTTEAIFFLGVIAVAGALCFFSEWLLQAYPGFLLYERILPELFLAATFVYGILGLALDSRMIWVFAVLALGNWFGTETGYRSGGGAYYLGLNYPLRFVLFGLLLCGLGVLFRKNGRWPRLASFERSTLSMGLLYLFISLWILSIFGDYRDLGSWHEAKHMELFHWSLLFGAAACIALWIGIRRDDGMLRGYGLVFLGLNLYTRFFEWFWDSLHKGLFFIIVGISLWFLGSRAERLWNLGHKPASPPESQEDPL